MKYYIIVGYCHSEKYKEYPTVTVSVNGTLIEEFVADNEDTKEITTKWNMRQDIKDIGKYNLIREQDWTLGFNTTTKHKIIEVETDDWPEQGELELKVSNNNSDYNNGFVSKRSIITLQPIVLINKDLFHNKALMQRLFNKMARVEEVGVTSTPSTKVTDDGEIEDRQLKRTDNETRTRWPGVTSYRLHGAPVVNLTRGGNFNVKLKIIKKHKTFLLATDKWNMRGYFFTDLFFSAWYQYISKEHFKIQIDQSWDMTTAGGKYGKNDVSSAKVKLVKINNTNEDQ